MSKAAQSLFAFGLYAMLAGVAFLAAPDALLSTMHWPAMPSGWARLIGLLALVIGTYDIVSARAGCLAYIRASVFVRFGFAAGATMLVVSGQMPVSVLLLGAVDAAGAIWTAVALRQGRIAA